MESSVGASAGSWTEPVEDLLHSGEVDQAISLLESTVSNLEHELEKEEFGSKISGKPSMPLAAADQLSFALHDLSKLYSSKGLSLKADQTLSRALQIKHSKGGLPVEKEPTSDECCKVQFSQNEATSTAETVEHGYGENSSNSQNDGLAGESGAEDDWEAMADRAPEELLSPQNLPGISDLSLEDSKGQSPRRRGRGTFSYNKQGLYSDHPFNDEPVVDDSEHNPAPSTEDPEERNITYGTRHVLVLADFPLSTRTTDLEKLLERFKDRFVIRWVNDTTSLAVFKEPSLATEAINSIRCPFTIRRLNEDDELVSLIPPRDLQPPRPRPRTTPRAAQKMIAHELGIKLPSNFGSSELRRQEEARRNRIISRQNMRDDAWGDS